MKTHALTMAFVGSLFLAAACDGGTSSGLPDGPPGAFQVVGQIVGSPVPADATVIVAWTVSSGSPDYAYKFGEGVVQGSAFSVVFNSDPPAEAVNRAFNNDLVVGVGDVLLVPANTHVPDGVFDPATITVAGITNRSAIIWRGPASGLIDWTSAFPLGYGCGSCVDNGNGSFDSYTPDVCGLVTIMASPDLRGLDFCNWT